MEERGALTVRLSAGLLAQVKQIFGAMEIRESSSSQFMAIISSLAKIISTASPPRFQFYQARSR